ncbi:MAG: hypothetical protein DPW16_15345 [Chloroflexi bacterium]|nr:hypothetical protein [Chloroflexota bacterium]
MLRSLLLLLASLCGLTTLFPALLSDNTTTPSQTTTPPILEFVEYQRLDELGDTRNMTISPDGSKLVWPDDTSFCIYEIASAATECISTGDVTLRVMTGFTWSPDSRYLAFHEDVFLRFYESDLWVFDFETRQLVNLTDDGVIGDALPDDGVTLVLDYAPVWGPDNTLYFFRTLSNLDIEPVPFYLYRLELKDGPENADEPEQVADLTSTKDEPFAVYNSRSDVLDGSVSLSPDGQMMAFLVRPSDLSKGQSIWVVDIASGEAHPVAAVSDLIQSGIPAWGESDLWLNGLGWSGDGQYLVATTISPVTLGMPEPAYAIDVDSGEIMTLIDFSDVPDEQSFLVSSVSDQVTGRYDLIRAATMTPDGSYAVYFNFNGSDVGVSGLPLLPPNDSNTPLRLFRFAVDEFTGPMPMFQSTAGDDGEYVRVLLLGYMYTFAKR